MMYQLTVPSMEGVQELRVLQWYKTEGQPVAADELLVELETDKAVVEVRSPRACVLRKVFVGQGSWAEVGGPPIALFSDEAEEAMEPDAPTDLMPLWAVM